MQSQLIVTGEAGKKLQATDQQTGKWLQPGREGARGFAVRVLEDVQEYGESQGGSVEVRKWLVWHRCGKNAEEWKGCAGGETYPSDL